MDDNNRNFILAIVLSMAVLFAWQYFFVPSKPPVEAGKQAAQQEQQQQPSQSTPGPQAPGAQSSAPAPGGAAQPAPNAPQASTMSREEAIAASPRVPIDTPSIKGSINLKGARIDDVVLKKYRETVEPTSPNVVLLSPSGAPDAYYSEQGWVAGAESKVDVPGPDTVWQAAQGATLTPQSPLTLTYDNGKGLIFKRTIAVDENYMFTVTDAVENTGSEAGDALPLRPRLQARLPPYPKLLHPA